MLKTALILGTLAFIHVVDFSASQTPETPTFQFLSRSNPCNVTAHNLYTTVLEMKNNHAVICDPRIHLRCIEDSSEETRKANQTGKCLCDPLLAKQQQHEEKCLGLYGAPCDVLTDYSGSLKIEASCYLEGDLQCAEQKAKMRKLRDGDTETDKLLKTEYGSASMCTCKTHTDYPRSDMTCSGGAARGGRRSAGAGLLQPARDNVTRKEVWYEVCNILFYILVAILWTIRQ